MVRYAQNSPLPCNPTLDEGKRYEHHYNSTIKLGMLSEDKLKIRIKSFFNNHLSQIVQAYSLVFKGSKSKTFSVQNKINKSLFQERKTNLETLSAYFQQNQNFLEVLEMDLKTNFKNEMMEIFQKIKKSILTTIDMYEDIVKKEIASIKANISQNVQNVQNEMKKLRLEQGQKLILTQNGKLSHNEISKILSISSEDVKGYQIIFKIVERSFPLMRRLSSLEEELDENDELSNCQREIEGLNIFCDQLSCGEMWHAVQLLKKKGEFTIQTPSHQNSFSSHNNSFTSYQSPNQTSFSAIKSEILAREPNPQVEFNHSDLIGNYENCLKQVEKQIVCKLYSLLNCYNVASNKENSLGTQKTHPQSKRQPFSFFFNENLLYKIHLQSKEIVECEFQKLNERNRSSNISFNFTNQKGFYELLNSSSQNQSDSEDDKIVQNQVKINQEKPMLKPIQKNVPFIPKNSIPQISIQGDSKVKNPLAFVFSPKQIESKESTTVDKKEDSSVKKEFISYDSSIERKNLEIFQQYFNTSGQKEQDTSEIYFSRESPKKVNYTTLNFKQDTIIKVKMQEDEQSAEKADQSRLHYASASEDDSQNQEEKKIDAKKEIQQINPPIIPLEKSENEESPHDQYIEYINKKKMLYSEQQRKEKSYNEKQDTQQLEWKLKFKEEEQLYEANQRKLDYEEAQQGKKFRQNLKNDHDRSQMGDYHQRSKTDEGEVDKILASGQRQKISKFPHNLSHDEQDDEKYETQSVLERDPEKKKIIDDWNRSRQMEQYSYIPKEQQDQELVEYVSYDYGLENQKQKPYQGRMPVYDQFLYELKENQENILPKEISWQVNIKEQESLLQHFKKKNVSSIQPKEESRFKKKLEAIVQNVIIPGFHAIKKQKQNKNVQELASKKAKQQKDNQESLMQFALNLSLQQTNQRPNQKMVQVPQDINKDIPNLIIDETPMKEDNSQPKFKQQENSIISNIMPKERFQEENEEDFTVFQDIFKEFSSLKATFSLKQNFNPPLFEDEDQNSFRPMIRSRPNELTIQQIRLREDELDISKEDFGIFVKILKPILLTFRNFDKYKNRPMAKFIVGDRTGIAVLYMNYYLEIKTGSCLRLNRCRVNKFRGSYEITHASSISLHNIMPGDLISTVNQSNPLSLIRRSKDDQLTYEVRPSCNELLRDCVRDFVRKQSYEAFIIKPLILTVCGATQKDKRYLFGDYTGRILADLSNCPKVDLKSGDTVLIRNIRICFRGDKLLLVGQKNTVILKADSDWRFSHDINFLSETLFIAK